MPSATATQTKKRTKPLAPGLRSFRSAITSGRAMFLVDDVDGRSKFSRRVSDLLAAHVSDLGGEDNISEAERSLVRRAVMLTVQLEMMEHRWASASEGEASPKQLMAYQTTTNSLRRTLETLGLQRRAKDVTPTLSEYLRARQTNGDDGETIEAGAAE